MFNSSGGRSAPFHKDSLAYLILLTLLPSRRPSTIGALGSRRQRASRLTVGELRFPRSGHCRERCDAIRAELGAHVDLVYHDNNNAGGRSNDMGA